MEFSTETPKPDTLSSEDKGDQRFYQGDEKCFNNNGINMDSLNVLGILR